MPPRRVHLSRVLLLSLLLAVLSARPAVARVAPPTDDPPPIAWTLTLDLPLDQTADLAARLSAAASTHGLTLRSAPVGQGGLAISAVTLPADLPAALHASLNWLSGPADLLLTIPLPSSAQADSDETLILLLDANLSTGYTWDWSALDPALLAAQPTYVPRSSAAGAPALLTLPLRVPVEDTGSAAGPLELRLRYRRPWQSAAAPHAVLALSTESLPAVLDLSDPALPLLPAVDLASAVGAGSAVDTGDAADPPAAFDWRDHAALTPVRDQGACGSCWAFTATGLLESSLAVFGGPRVDLSEQYLINCNEQGWGCDGGSLSANDFHQFAYISPQLAAGAVLESTLPYRARQSLCAAPYAHPHRLARWSFLPGLPPTEADIKQAVYTYGPVAAMLCVGPAFNGYSGGLFATDEAAICAPGLGNHAVLITGWDDANRVWHARNSWGPDWGDHGYIHIRYGVSNIGYYAHYAVPTLLPAAPVRQSPAAGALFPAGAPAVLRWAAVPGATAAQPIHYQVQLSRDAVFTAPLLDQTIDALQLSADLPANTLLYWRVRAVRQSPDGPQTGPWSAAGALKTLPAAPTLLAPVPPVPEDAPIAVDTVRPVFTWSADLTAARFDLQIARDLAFTRRVLAATIATPAYTPTADLPRAVPLFWRVRARGSYGVGTWSAPAAFTVPPAPGVPALLSPAAGAVLAPVAETGSAAPLTLRWKPAAVPAGSAAPPAYQVQLYPIADPDAPLLDATTDPAALALPVPDALPPNARLAWRVRALFALETGRIYGGWSAPRALSTPPLVPVPLQPTPADGTGSGSALTSLRPVFTWEPPTGGASSYDLQIHTGPGCARLLRSGAAPAAASVWTPASDLPRRAALSWRVRARGPAGISPWSACLAFTTPHPPAVPALRSPAGGAVLPVLLTADGPAAARPSFTWAAAPVGPSAPPAPQGYTLQLADNPVFNAPTERAIPAPDPATALSLDWDADLAPGVYYWRARAEGGGLVSAWSAGRSFKTPAALSGVVTDAHSGLPVAGAVVRIADTPYASAPTAADGLYRLPATPSGSRKLVVTAPDYSPATRAITVQPGGERVFNLRLSRLPVKIVLEWGGAAHALDAQLWLPAERPYHLHSHARGSLAGFPFAALSGGTTPRAGPETVTVARRESGVYTYAVYGWPGSGSGPLSGSNAVVKVYFGGALRQTFSLPPIDSHMPWWHVFDLVADTGEIIPGAGLMAASPGPYEPYPGSSSQGSAIRRPD